MLSYYLGLVFLWTCCLLVGVGLSVVIKRVMRHWPRYSWDWWALTLSSPILGGLVGYCLAYLATHSVLISR